MNVNGSPPPGEVGKTGARRSVGILLAVMLVAVLVAGLFQQLQGSDPGPADPGERTGARGPAAVSGTPLAVTPPPPQPCDGVPVQPSDNLQAAVDAHPEGTEFCLRAGVHRLATAVPKNDQRFIGEGTRTVLSGARVLSPADADRDRSGRFYWEGQTQQSRPWGELVGRARGEAPNPGDRFNEELFVTASGDPADPPERYQRIMELGDLEPGKWFFDYRADRIYIAEDPAGLGLIETSVIPKSLDAPDDSPPRGVVVENLVVEKYASPAQEASLSGERAVDWDIRYVTARYSHGAGIDLGPGTLMEHSLVHHMGQEGLTGGGEALNRPTVLRHSEIAYNKTLSFDPVWEAGGAKFFRVFGKGMIVENSWFHHNRGAGLWFDIDNYNVIIRSNRFEANDRWGLFYEVSRQGEIYWNEAFDNRRGPEDGRLGGAGIAISNSADVKVYENVVYNNDNGIYVKEDREVTRWAPDSYREGLPHIENVHIYDNDIAMGLGVTGMEVENGDGIRYWDQTNVSFFDNTYRLHDGEDQFIGRGNEFYTFGEWQALGQDTDGAALPVNLGAGAFPSGAKVFAKTEYGARS